MLINEEQKKILRKEIEKKLKNAKVNSRTHIDKNTLEQLLFDIKEDGTKMIVWSGDFLSKIDLSEVSFDDVFWSCTEDSNGRNIRVVLDNTNANIDFSKRTTHYHYIQKFEGCSFRNMDLTHSNIDQISEFSAVIFDGAKLPAGFFENKKFDHCSLENIDLSLTIDSYQLYNRFKYCNLSHTNTFITHEIRKLTDEEKRDLKRYNYLFGQEVNEGMFYKQFLSDDERREKMELEEKYESLMNYLDVDNVLKYAIRNDKLVGCMVNGEVIKSQASKKEDFNEFKKSLLDSFSENIVEQEQKPKKQVSSREGKTGFGFI